MDNVSFNNSGSSNIGSDGWPVEDIETLPVSTISSGSLIDQLFSGSSITDVNKKFLTILGRGSKYQCFWKKEKKTLWFEIGKYDQITFSNPKTNILNIFNGDVYFGVNPSKLIPENEYQRTSKANLGSVNCFFGDFDGKDGWTLDKIKQIKPEPSVIISSGGGFHCYWFLKDTIIIDDKNYLDIQRIQWKWVDFIGSDPGAKDLSRILRMPGSKNTKYDPSKDVEFLKVDFDLFYDLKYLTDLLPEKEIKVIKNNYIEVDSDGNEQVIKFELPEIISELRNVTLFKYGCSLRAYGFEEADIYQELFLTNGERCYPPLDGKELDDIVKSIVTRYEIGKAKKVETTISKSGSDVYNQRIHIRDLNYILEPPPPVVYMVQDLIELGITIIIYGAPGSLKTYLMILLCLCLSNGKDFLGFKTNGIYPTLYIDEESGNNRLHRQYHEVINGLDWIPTQPMYFNSMSRLKPAKPEEVDLVYQMVKDTGAKFIVFDTLSECLDGNENLKEVTQPYMSNLKQLAFSQNVTNGTIHHPGKNDTGPRGSYSLVGSAELIIKVTNTCEDGSEIGYLELFTEKFKINGKSTITVKYEFGHDSFGEKFIKFTRCEDISKPKNTKLKGANFQVVDYLKTNGKSLRTDIFNWLLENTEFSKSSISHAFDVLSNDLHLIERVDDGGIGKKSTYDLTISAKTGFAKVLGE